jgi:hypothetical protein
MIVFSGCAAQEPVQDTFDVGNGSSVVFDETKTSATTGGIAGVIVDETIAPVAGINVSIEGLQTSAISSEQGVYQFEDIAPGVYFVSFTGPDHLPSQQSAEVEAGAVTKLRTQLAIDPAPKPYHNTLKFDWFDSAGQPLVDFAWDLFRPSGAPTLCDACEWTLESDAPVETFVLEAFWEDSVSPPDGPSRFYWSLEPTEDSGAYESDYFANPGYLMLEGNPWGAYQDFFLMMAYDETWLAVDQSAEVFVTMFYHGEAPDGFSIAE